MNSMVVESGTGTDAPVLRATRALLAVFGVLTFLAVAALFVRPDTTDRFFAWTIQPPVTAAFLGAAYAAGCTLVVLSLRASVWVNARAALVTILVFTALTLWATLVHRDRFHFGDDKVVARGAAWFWLVVYVVVPVALAGVLVLQARTSGADAPRGRPLPRWLAAALAVEGAMMLIIGLSLFVRPGLVTVWPWFLTALTSRAIGAWLIAFGVAAVAALVENDLSRLRASAVAYLVFAVAELVVVLRFAHTLRWDATSTWVYLAFLILVAGTAAAGVRLTAAVRPDRADPTEPTPRPGHPTGPIRPGPSDRAH
ncbi:MAG TPA: hypothetical protein VMT69_18000 [Kineosporiaceae bacterium]|nr:hypothetical protein [Kineosporiaceae bacterium]